MLTLVTAAALVGSLLVLTLQLVQLRRPPRPPEGLMQRLDAVERAHERMERSVRDELQRKGDEAAVASRSLRDEVRVAVRELSQGLAASLSQTAQQIERLTQANDAKLETVRGVIDERLRHLQQDNAAKLEQMRATVDEKLQGALEKRLGESFKLVSERLELVHKGLGEMQSLATGVGDLKKVLTNVKTRGTWGEMQLAGLLEQTLTPDQYAANVATRPNSNQRVEFAVRMPGQGGETVWLPIDAKFPQEDYQRLVEASERGDAAGVEQAGKALEQHARACARDIRDKYLAPPHTTDFAFLFVPTEALYAELLRRPGLAESLMCDLRVCLTGPMTLTAALNSLQMGFRTLAIQKRSSEVWKVLGAVKAEFGRFGEVLGKVQKKLHEASGTIEDAAKRTRIIENRLRKVEELPSADGREPRAIEQLELDEVPRQLS